MKNDVSAADDLVEKDLEINKDVADENDDVDDLLNEKEDAADMNDVVDRLNEKEDVVDGLEMINNDRNDAADGLEMINNDDVGLEDAVVDGLEMINNAAVVDDDKDSSAVDDASAVDGLEMNKEVVVDDDQNKDAAAETVVVETAADEEANENKDEEPAAVVDKNAELGKKELATKKKRKVVLAKNRLQQLGKKRKMNEEADMEKMNDEEADMGKKNDEEGQSFRRKKRSTQLGNYTDPNGKSFKLIDPVTVNPLLDYDSELLDELKQWLKLEDEDKINLVLFHAGRELFNRMLRPQNWLHDQQVKKK
ncbi:coiled-coil domain-containing protein 1-like [Impatiens glandulifera]|uniref:coiled-coil domain-containing protein 1-like n=1 Tax=Impatiens glandulifera TaxID=253017 RepID=UPI001FB1060B|nr:coiled-coil domain-containing protein 1-like [Impatiens glandulifera]